MTSGQNISWTSSGVDKVVTAPAGGMEQVIEGASIEGGTYVLSWTGTATATVAGNAVTSGVSFTLTANTNTTVRFTGGTVSLPQLEQGSIVTTFERRPFALELALCQRYYEKSFPQTTAPAQNAGLAGSFQLPSPVGASVTIQAVYIPFQVIKRTTPTVTLYNPLAANAQARNKSLGTDCTSTSAYSDGNDRGIVFTATTPASTAAGHQLIIHFTADAEI